MIELITEAINAQEYEEAERLIEQLQQQEPDHPWLEYEQGFLAEAQGNLKSANQIYIGILRASNHSKVINQARQGIKRIEGLVRQKQQAEKQLQKANLAIALSQPKAQELGVLILEPLPAEIRKNVASQFAQLMEIETYNAFMTLPTRFWRLYRTGKKGELNYYVSELAKINIPAFAFSLAEIKRLQVYQVDHFDSDGIEATVTYHQQESQTKTLRFNWLEVKSVTEGMLPILSVVWDKDVRGESQQKFSASDYIQFCDLHLTNPQVILRLSEQSYKYGAGITHIFDLKEQTIHKHWQQLIDWLKQYISHAPIYSDFRNFGQIALDFSDFLTHLEPKIYLFRQQETLWDQAFELYSRLVFLKA